MGDFEELRRLPRVQRANFAARRVRAGDFFLELFAITFEPDAKCMLGGFSAVREEQRKIIRDGFIDPLIPVTGPAHDVAPPLMRDFMIGDDIRKCFLPGGRESGAVLRFGGQERKR